uniref:Uncharacterized protein n=1 Tax=Heterorhabditis bacteriophora TaxID=37862 RepID=A0A1I7WF26_HETBA
MFITKHFRYSVKKLTILKYSFNFCSHLRDMWLVCSFFISQRVVEYLVFYKSQNFDTLLPMLTENFSKSFMLQFSFCISEKLSGTLDGSLLSVQTNSIGRKTILYDTSDGMVIDSHICS